MNFPTQDRKLPDKGTNKGFALVVTLSLMILLTLIAVGLLSLSSVSLRSSSQAFAMSEARANARLALMIAMGEIQKQLGPDRRISAKAEILDKTPESGVADDVTNPHYLGVWESWDTWLTDKKGTLSIQDTYKRGRDSSLFRAWLVSHPDSGKYATAISTAPAADWVELCGKNSAGPDVANHVKVRRSPVKNGTRVTGNYAWWVSDESLKARLDLKGRETAATLSAAQIASSQTGRTGIEKMTSMSTYDTKPESIAKMITPKQAGISAPGISEHFHDITAYSLGLLTDVRSGGFKSDLNLAFESSNVPQEMNKSQLFGGRPFEAPIRPMTGELSKITPQDPYIAPMGWRSLREYYRLYRDFPGSAIYKPIRWNSGKPFTNRFLMGSSAYKNKWDVAGYTRLPLLLRQTWVLATTTQANPAAIDKRDYYILAIPVVSLWNPYNIALEVSSTEISFFGSLFYAVPMVQRTYRDNTPVGSETVFPQVGQWADGTKPNGSIDADQLGYRMIPMEKSAGTIRFAPGEVRIFSTDDDITSNPKLFSDPNAMGNRHFAATPGFTPVKDKSGVLRGLRCKVYPGTSSSGTLNISLRMAVSDRVIDSYYIGGSKKSVIGFSFQELYGPKQGVYNEDGSDAGRVPGEWHDVNRLNIFSLDWLRSEEINSAWVVPDTSASRARWPEPGQPPLPIGIVSIVAKSPEQLKFNATGGFARDFRNRGWLHAPPTGMGCLLVNPDDLNRADCAYQIHFVDVTGDQEVSQYLQADGPNGFYGGGYSKSSGQSHVTALDLPIEPIQSLGAFSGARVFPARCFLDQLSDSYISPSVPKPTGAGPYINRRYFDFKHAAVTGAAFGAGVGNAYGHPMIAPEKVYTRNQLGTDPGWDGTNTNNFSMTDDYWDHLFLANEELWDSWFCSGIAPVTSNGSVVTPKKTVAENFFSDLPKQLSPHFQPDKRGKTAQELSNLVETTTAATGANGWDLIGSHILNKGQFNVNSTSKEAWKALLLSLANRPIACNDPKTGTSVIPPDANQVSLSRHPLANGASEANGPGDDNAWRGIRKLSESQIDKLAEQIVRQVKLRGPFLNMAEFINRRLTTDDTGVVGALQAAIDWDEFNAGYDGTTKDEPLDPKNPNNKESINKAYKGSSDMISNPPVTYPNQKAARGSRYAGIPGYVMQSDILQGISSSLSARGDTFVVRAYGESLTADGNVAATAWCEAVVQRLPEYVDPADAAEKKMRIAGNLPGQTATLSPANLAFGRQFKITSFRWLNKDEI